MPIDPRVAAAAQKYTSTDHKGKPLSAAHQQAMLKPNPMVAKILAARAQSLSDDERNSLKGVLTPQTAPALKKLLPELAKLFDKGLSANGG